jgi:hypothetical protein
MYQNITGQLLRLFKVPHEPEPPHGNPASLRVFRAGRNLFNLRLFGWAVGQVLALAGIIFWVFVFISIETETSRRRETQQVRTPLTVDSFTKTIESAGKRVVPAREKGKNRRPPSWAGFKRGLGDVAMLLPPWAFPLLWVLKIVGILAYLVQLPVTYLIARMDYELRWYMVTDRSLRIRYGVWKVSESTMSFANIQQVVVSQGPLQRLLGLSDVKVQSAGGGSGGHDSHGNPHGNDDMHMGLFHSVTNAPEIRDLILERLRRFRESGLGDPEEKTSQSPSLPTAATTDGPADLLAAARELAAEARALRASLG